MLQGQHGLIVFSGERKNEGKKQTKKVISGHSSPCAYMISKIGVIGWHTPYIYRVFQGYTSIKHPSLSQY